MNIVIKCSSKHRILQDTKHLYKLTKLSSLQINHILFNRSYQSSKGVYGYNPKVKEKQQHQPNEDDVANRAAESNLYRLISAYREYGHLQAKVNPLNLETRQVTELNPSLYGLLEGGNHDVTGLLHGSSGSCSLEDVVSKLKEKYCGHLGFEFMYLPTMEEREWFAQVAESSNDYTLSEQEQVQLATHLLKSQIWDNFLASKYQSVKRYGGEGAEAAIGYYYHTLNHLAKNGVEQVILGMAHRGRLNLLTGLLDVPAVIMFRKMKGLSEFPSDVTTSGDVLSHLVSSVDLELESRKLHVTMFPNPSHLEAVNPVVCGKTRGRQQSLGDGHYSQDTSARPGEKVVCLQIHGDAAVSGQGVMQETLALSEVPHFDIGGAIHMVVNNQIGYTTPAARYKSSAYCTDIAKMVAMPVIHVNGNEPEAVVKAAKIAVDYQRQFRRDVFVDLICWRRWGHNELDNPRFTNPSMYLDIDARRSVPDLYAESLIEKQILTKEEINKITSEHMAYLNAQFKLTDSYVPKAPHLQKHWSGLVQAPKRIEVWNTGVDGTLLKKLGAKSVQYPDDDFTIHSNLVKSHVQARLQKLTEGKNIDWATAEALAMASLLNEGMNVRLSGQDVGRGTFSQRHCVLVDQATDEMYLPLNHIDPDQKGHLEIANSILSEEAVLGFEYGISVEDPNTLCIWEAQFGDFYNGAQIIIDTFVSSGETKWLTQSGLVMVLPTGYDGAGPEHSSCHIERFLQNCDSKEDTPDSESVNWNIIHPTTPAQYFHALRRQLVRNYRKPLIVAGPKILLRLPAATSTLEDMKPGTSFIPVIDDPQANPDNVQRIVFVSGKHYYTIAAEVKSRKLKNIAVVRLEALCPFPCGEINVILKKYRKAKEFIWSQEEHRNMGAWFFVNPRFQNLCATKLKYVGRDVLGTTAVGIGNIHKEESQSIIHKTFS